MDTHLGYTFTPFNIAQDNAVTFGALQNISTRCFLGYLTRQKYNVKYSFTPLNIDTQLAYVHPF